MLGSESVMDVGDRGSSQWWSQQLPLVGGAEKSENSVPIVTLLAPRSMGASSASSTHTNLLLAGCSKLVARFLMTHPFTCFAEEFPRLAEVSVECRGVGQEWGSGELEPLSRGEEEL